MKTHSLRFKSTLLVMITWAVIAVLFGAILFPFEANRRRGRMGEVEHLLGSVFEQKRDEIANEIFMDKKEALLQSIEHMRKVQGVRDVTVYLPDGEIMAATEAFPPQAFSASERHYLNSSPAFYRTETAAGEPLAVYATAVESLGERVGYLKMTYDLSGLEREFLYSLLFYLSLLLCTLLAMSLFLNYMLFRSVIRPVSILRNAMREVQAGGSGSRVELAGDDEIAEMASAFNDMSAQLAEKHAALSEALKVKEVYAVQLEETNRELERLNEDLENMVAARTAELQASNRKLTDEIAERSRAEAGLANEKEFLSVTLGSIADGVISTDAEGRVVLINGVAATLLGLSAEEAQGAEVEEVFSLQPEDEGRLELHPIRRALESEAGPETRTEAVLAAAGAQKHIAYSAAPIKSGRNEVIGAVLVFRDVTAQKMLEEDARKAANLESLGILAGGVAHDFNNILTAVLANLSLAKLYGDASEKTREKLDEAEKAVMQAKGLTLQLLTFSKGGAPIKTATSIRDLIMDTASFALSGSKTVCRFEADDELWALDADPSQISQVINNLVINANQAMAEGGLIAINARNRLVPDNGSAPVPPGKWVEITIRDQGPGIPEEIREQVFDPYFSTKETGTGLGLTTSRSIIKQHGGTIEVENGPEPGAAFRIFLPASGVDVPRAAAEKEALADGQGRILIMDDEESILEVALEALELLGYKVETALTGEQALEKYTQGLQEKKPFDVVIMDLTIPGGMGGRETLDHLLKIDPAVKAVVSSGYSQDAIMSDFRRHGFVDVLPKPFKVYELSQVLKRVLLKNRPGPEG